MAVVAEVAVVVEHRYALVIARDRRLQDGQSREDAGDDLVSVERVDVVRLGIAVARQVCAVDRMETKSCG